MTRVLISGGSGLIGKHLSDRLLDSGYEVAILSRKARQLSGMRTYVWDPDKNEIDPEATRWADLIIHLAGADIGKKRWTPGRRRLILESRVKPGQLIFDKVREQEKKLQAFISASAIGYYGTITSDHVFQEEDAAATDFLGETCLKWEQMSGRFTELGIRTVIIRTGVVLTKRGGALERMMMPLRMGFGMAIGSGKQYLPWIHIDDLCGIYIKAIEDIKMHGAYNAVSPESSTNKEFMKTAAQSLNKAVWLPNLPAFIMRIVFGKMSSVLLEGSRVSAEKIMAEGYIFRFPALDKALQDLL